MVGFAIGITKNAATGGASVSTVSVLSFFSGRLSVGFSTRLSTLLSGLLSVLLSGFTILLVLLLGRDTVEGMLDEASSIGIGFIAEKAVQAEMPIAIRHTAHIK